MKICDFGWLGFLIALFVSANCPLLPRLHSFLQVIIMELKIGPGEARFYFFSCRQIFRVENSTFTICRDIHVSGREFLALPPLIGCRQTGTRFELSHTSWMFISKYAIQYFIILRQIPRLLSVFENQVGKREFSTIWAHPRLLGFIDSSFYV